MPKTVRRNFEQWTKLETQAAILARTHSREWGIQEMQKVKQMVNVNDLRNPKVCSEHGTNATYIFAPRLQR